MDAGRDRKRPSRSSEKMLRRSTGFQPAACSSAGGLWNPRESRLGGAERC